MVNQLLEIQWNIAKAEQTDRKVQNLATYINVEVLKEIHRAMDGEKATGIDKVTKQDYEQNLEENLQKLVQRMKNGSYKPQPEETATQHLEPMLLVHKTNSLLLWKLQA